MGDAFWTFVLSLSGYLRLSTMSLLLPPDSEYIGGQRGTAVFNVLWAMPFGPFKNLKAVKV